MKYHLLLLLAGGDGNEAAITEENDVLKRAASQEPTSEPGLYKDPALQSPAAGGHPFFFYQNQNTFITSYTSKNINM